MAQAAESHHETCEPHERGTGITDYGPWTADCGLTVAETRSRAQRQARGWGVSTVRPEWPLVKPLGFCGVSDWVSSYDSDYHDA